VGWSPLAPAVASFVEQRAATFGAADDQQELRVALAQAPFR
jgi:hypothetical protein